MAYSSAKSVFKNGLTMMGAQSMTWLAGFAVFIFVPRILGSDAYGRVYLALSFQMILWSVIDYGAIFHITKEISRDRDNASTTMSDAASLRLILWVISVIVAFLTCELAGYSGKQTLLIIILVVSNLWINLTSIMRDCYLGFEDVKYPSIGAVVERGALALTVIPALFLGAREVVVVMLIGASGLLSFWISARHSRSMFRIRLSFHLRTMWRLLQDGLPYFLWAIFGMIYFRIDAVLLSLMAPDSVVGWYGAAYRLFDIAMFLPSIMAQVLYPIISRLSQTGGDAMVKTTQRSLEFLLLAGVAVAIGYFSFARPIIGLILGLRQYSPSIVVLQILSVGAILVYVDFALGNAVQAVDKQKQWAVVGFIAMILNIGLNMFLIKYFQVHNGNGGIGAAIATDVTEFFVMLAAAYLLPKELFDKRIGGVFVKAILSGAVMGLLIFGGAKLDIPWIALAVIGLLGYAGFLFILKTFDERELELMAKAVHLKSLKRALAERGRTTP